nr:hypothetical protein [Tanacetum cinerariifolium]
MDKPLSPDRVFDFPMDEPKPHLAYEFFTPGPLPGYVVNPNNMNGWIEEDVLLLREIGESLRAKLDKPMVDPVIDEIAEPIVEIEEQMVASVMDMEGDLAMLFGDDDSSDDRLDNEEDDEKVGGPSTTAVEGHSLALPAHIFLVPSLVIEDLCTLMGNLEYVHRQLVKKVIQVSDAEVADGIAIGEIGPKVFVIEGQVQVMASQMVQVVGRLEQVGT